jgi:hypothetical protein
MHANLNLYYPYISRFRQSEETYFLCDLVPVSFAEEHRELVRQCLRTLLEAGHSPLNYFQHDLKKYFYLAEVMSLVDLSLVGCRL